MPSRCEPVGTAASGAVVLLVVAMAGCRGGAAPRGAGRAGEPGRRVISTDNAPPAIGPYSQAVQVGDTLYLSGQIAINPATGQLVSGGIEPQTRQVMNNCKAILEAAGFTFEDVVQVQIFLYDIDDYTKMNEIYAVYFGNAPPARVTAAVDKLPRGAKVEIMMTAVKRARPKLVPDRWPRQGCTFSWLADRPLA